MSTIAENLAALQQAKTDIASAITNKGGTVNVGDGFSSFAADIATIPSGGGGGDFSGSDVVFYDYDGTIVQSYSAADFLALSAMPANPSHTGFVAQGWNWTLSDAKAYVTRYGKLNVGQMYTTASELHEFDIDLTRATGLTVSFAMSGTKDWGDGTTDSTTSHTYANYGAYTIKCNGTSLPSYIMGQGSSTINWTLKAVRLANGISNIGDSSFLNCRSLKTITLPSSVTRLYNRAFQNSSLVSITIPTSAVEIQGTFRDCHTLKSVSLPNGLRSIQDYAFNYCYSLTSVTLPDYYTISLGPSAFNTCYSLNTITLPNSVTNLPSSVFSSCYALTSITMPDSITSIGINAFYADEAITLYDFSSFSSIPTLVATSAFGGNNYSVKIVVPDLLYDEWIIASNWVTLANYIYKASEVNL